MPPKKRKSRPSPSRKDRKNRKKKSLRSKEITLVALILIGVFFLISLISYDSQDPSWASSATATEKISNYAGKAGASAAELLLQIMGFAAFLVPLGLFYFGLQGLLPGKRERAFLKAGSFLFFVLLLCGLLHSLFDMVGWRGTEIPSGGLLGVVVSDALVRYFNHTGTLLILVGLLILLVMFSTRLSLGRILQVLAHFLGFMFKEIRLRITLHQKAKRRERMKKKVIEKYAPKKTEPEEEKKKKPHKKKIRLKKAKKPPTPPSVPPPEPAPVAKEKYLFPEIEKKEGYVFPPFNLLDPGKESEQVDKNELYQKKQIIEEKLGEFKIEGEVREYHPGPVLTTYEFSPYPGVKVSQVASYGEDLSLALRAESVRIQRIPGKSSLGIEVPNNKREIIKIRDIIQTEKFQKSPSKLTVALGKTIHGEPYITDLSIMPHLLIAGATGSGKSVALNAIIASILYKASPEEVKLILIDPKRLEFSIYDGIPHLLCPVVKDPRKAEAILLDAIKKMEDRYHKLGLLRVRNIEQYNQQVRRLRRERKGALSEEEDKELQPLAYLVIIIDELAELMMIGAQEVEYGIARLAQLARAVGIHLVMATQRPSIDVITGTIKNNFSSRIAFRVPSKVDSRIIIDTAGAEKLLGMGDMLFMPPNYPRILRLHCSFISLPEITRLVKFVKEQGKPIYDEKIVSVLKSSAAAITHEKGEKDPLFEKAVELVLLTGHASASYLQRKLKLGYARAARIVDQMEQEGIVGPSEGSKPREILVSPEAYLRGPRGEE